jgi:hypothetical protein
VKFANLRYGQAQLGAHSSHPVTLVRLGELRDHALRQFHGAFGIGIDDRQQGLGKPHQVPMRSARLIAKGIAPKFVDRAKDDLGVIRFHEGTGPEIDRFAANGHVVRVHHAMDESDHHPSRNQAGLPLRDALKQRKVRLLGVLCSRVVPVRHVVGKVPHRGHIAAHGKILERPDTNMARGHACQDGSGQAALPVNVFPRGNGRQRTGTWNSQRMHRFTEQIFAQHGP